MFVLSFHSTLLLRHFYWIFSFFFAIAAVFISRHEYAQRQHVLMVLNYNCEDCFVLSFSHFVLLITIFVEFTWLVSVFCPLEWLWWSDLCCDGGHARLNWFLESKQLLAYVFGNWEIFGDIHVCWKSACVLAIKFVFQLTERKVSELRQFQNTFFFVFFISCGIGTKSTTWVFF